MTKLFDSNEEAVDFIINLNRTLFLDNKEHIKKYYKVRRIHSSVLNSMSSYIDSGKLPLVEYFNEITDDLKRETNNMKIMLDNHEHNDAIIFNEVFMYKNNDKIPSLTEIYIEKKKFKDSEKTKMLYAMRDSVVGLFKIIEYDHANGYVTYQDVFTNKSYKIIDVSMSSLEQVNKDKEIYIYNRIIKYDGILFGTGLPCIFAGDNKKLQKFIKNHKYENCSDFSRCLMLYDISKASKNNMDIRNYYNY